MAKILIIDDEVDVRAVMARVLERAGHSVEIAANAAAGLEALGNGDVQLVITDVIMPGVNGVDLVRQLREASFGGRIIAISGGGNMASAGYAPEAITTSAYLASATKAGADAVLTKPFERQELVDLVRSVLYHYH